MKKVRTITQLQDLLDEDIAWRLKEISALKDILDRSKLADAVVRATVPILYAHWEGFVKNAAQWYVSFVRHQGYKYQELISCFAVFGFKSQLHNLKESKKAKINIEAIDFIRAQMNEKAKFPFENVINTRSNLNSEVFENIAVAIGVDPSKYSTKYQLIDKSLLARRNDIAHGKYLDIDAPECKTLADQTLELLRAFKTDIQNAASLETFKI
jgi:hypothetical protein